MCTTGPLADHPGVDGTTRVIRLEVALAGESLTGCVSDDLGGARRFDGRLGLLAAIDSLIAGPAPEPGQERPVDAPTAPSTTAARPRDE